MEEFTSMSSEVSTPLVMTSPSVGEDPKWESEPPNVTLIVFELKFKLLVPVSENFPVTAV